LARGQRDLELGFKAGPRCESPATLKGKPILSVPDADLCPLPSVGELAYARRGDPHEFAVTWQSPDTNLTGLRGFIVAYHRLDRNDRVKKYFVGPSVRGFRVADADDGAQYLVCLVTQGSSFTTAEEEKEETDDAENFTAATAVSDGFEDEEYEYDSSFYVMPLEWSSARERRSSDDEGGGIFDFGSFFSANPFSAAAEDGEVANDEFGWNVTKAADGSDLDFDALLSTNDTDPMSGEHTVVNLDSESSKCLQIQTPSDPARLSLIDNKRMSVIIGVSAGLLVFVFIILR